MRRVRVGPALFVVPRLQEITVDRPLSKVQEAAARAVAEDKLPDTKIAEAAGVTVWTLDKWKQRPAFRARVEEHRQLWRDQIKAEGIANKQNRIDALNERHRLMTEVIAARAKAHQWRSRAAQEADPEGFDFQAYTAAGAETGLMVHVVTYLKDGRREEWAVDTGLLKELREHEKQAAQEMGQWNEKDDGQAVHGSGVTITIQPVDYRLAIVPLAPEAIEGAHTRIGDD